jgi:hypothetical protein
MGRKATFSNEDLVQAWKKVAGNGGTRKDVIIELGFDPGTEAGRKAYNNVTQRVRALTHKGVTFPELTKGQGGQRTSVEDINHLNEILGG